MKKDDKDCEQRIEEVEKENKELDERISKLEGQMNLLIIMTTALLTLNLFILGALIKIIGG